MPDSRFDRLASDLHLGGIEHQLDMPAKDAYAAITVLTTCGHGHVFVVDQSRLPVGRVQLGVSVSGLRCMEIADNTDSVKPPRVMGSDARIGALRSDLHWVDGDDPEEADRQAAVQAGPGVKYAEPRADDDTPEPDPALVELFERPSRLDPKDAALALAALRDIRDRINNGGFDPYGIVDEMDHWIETLSHD